MPREKKLEPRSFLTTLACTEHSMTSSINACASLRTTVAVRLHPWYTRRIAFRTSSGRRRQRSQRRVTLNSAKGKKVRTTLCLTTLVCIEFYLTSAIHACARRRVAARVAHRWNCCSHIKRARQRNQRLVSLNSAKGNKIRTAAFRTSSGRPQSLACGDACRHCNL